MIDQGLAVSLKALGHGVERSSPEHGANAAKALLDSINPR
jgi:hypothetical protein